MIFAFEGLDASGKATQTVALVDRFKRYGMEAKRFEFPNYSSLTGAAISTNLRKIWAVNKPGCHPDLGEKGMSELVFQSLMVVDKLDLAPELATYVNDPGRHAILDRYMVSAIAYGGVNGLPDSWLWRIHEWLPQPNMWFFLDVPLDESVKRRPERRDRIESDLPYLEKVRQRYLNIFHNERHEDRKWNIINGIGTVDSVSETVWNLVQAVPQ